MAAISISVSELTGCFTIAIDSNDWETFSVIDGDSEQTTILIPRVGGAKHSQTEAQLMAFYLSAGIGSVEAVNQGLSMVLPGTSCNYLCTVVYSGGGASTPFTLTGVCQQVSTNYQPTGESPISFLQPHMTGAFSTTP